MGRGNVQFKNIDGDYAPTYYLEYDEENRDEIIQYIKSCIHVILNSKEYEGSVVDSQREYSWSTTDGREPMIIAYLYDYFEIVVIDNEWSLAISVVSGVDIEQYHEEIRDLIGLPDFPASTVDEKLGDGTHGAALELSATEVDNLLNNMADKILPVYVEKILGQTLININTIMQNLLGNFDTVYRHCGPWTSGTIDDPKTYNYLTDKQQ